MRTAVITNTTTWSFHIKQQVLIEIFDAYLSRCSSASTFPTHDVRPEPWPYLRGTLGSLARGPFSFEMSTERASKTGILYITRHNSHQSAVNCARKQRSTRQHEPRVKRDGVSDQQKYKHELTSRTKSSPCFVSSLKLKENKCIYFEHSGVYLCFKKTFQAGATANFRSFW